MKAFSGIVAWCLLLVLSPVVQSLHIYMKSGETKCFYEKLNAGNLLIGDLDVLVENPVSGIYEENSRIKVDISIDETFDNDERVLHQRNLDSGDFAFTALETGEHRVCLKPEYPNVDSKLRVFIELEVDHSSSLDSKRKDESEYLMNRIHGLTQRLHHIRQEQTIIRENETVFRNNSESANGRIMFWSLLQLIALIGVCAFQLRYLKNFFVKKKII
ncbi:hypothetical protein KAFR_0D05000 [Kazachstania africana CBS 2517]|uniref:GOLD domain-containing protein n=1 Tax=Kazachstania africana (strain ATCC 22294 / BCRC 22015 / CBS 2517 / CECT 1963 / NBRC 1671 / NRRL Y-8276) TaxID=1071382 RepID=H2AUU7_KAZAF|nr:hypothetical protein KAFR_0D05000 [Kazachstania africana CBS 2517]CCF58147.1 hypothetical protein KAFR_0D05000 [Kazachstania africana CBS 2517]